MSVNGLITQIIIWLNSYILEAWLFKYWDLHACTNCYANKAKCPVSMFPKLGRLCYFMWYNNIALPCLSYQDWDKPCFYEQNCRCQYLPTVELLSLWISVEQSAISKHSVLCASSCNLYASSLLLISIAVADISLDSSRISWISNVHKFKTNCVSHHKTADHDKVRSNIGTDAQPLLCVWSMCRQITSYCLQNYSTHLKDNVCSEASAPCSEQCRMWHQSHHTHFNHEMILDMRGKDSSKVPALLKRSVPGQWSYLTLLVSRYWATTLDGGPH